MELHLEEEVEDKRSLINQTTLSEYLNLIERLIALIITHW